MFRIKANKWKTPLSQAIAPVLEGLETRQLFDASTVQSLPWNLDFSTDRGELLDKDGQGTGFTRVQANTAGNQYQANLIDLDTTAGVLKLTTSGAGANSGTTNTQLNALETQFDGSTNGFTITARIKGPLSYMDATYKQAGIFFGPDQDNFVKLVAIRNTTGNFLQFRDEQNATTVTLPSSAQGVNIGNFANITTLDVRLAGDPLTGKVYAYYAINGGSFTKISSDLTLTGATRQAFFSPTARAGILALTSTTSSITVSYDSFGITQGIPSAGNPYVSAVRPGAGATAISRDAFVAADVVLPTPGAGIEPATLAGNVLVYRTSDRQQVQGVVNTSGGGDALVFTPSSLLDANTSYTFEVKSGLKDTSGASFQAFTSSFTTGTAGGTVNSAYAFEKVSLSSATGQSYTCVEIGPDGKLYASTVDGLIQRWTIGADGKLSSRQTITTIQDANGGQRLVSGFAFDPASTSSNPIIWVNNSQYAFTNASDWTGKLSKLWGSDLQNYQDVITGLPRAARDHLNNQPVFGPDGKLYFAQGSSSAMGAPDNAWGLRAEHLLTAAVLQLDLTKLPGTLPLDVQTEGVASPYDPFASNAPLKIYATGTRNTYDLLFHSNGHLYAPTNGSAANGATPASPSNPFSSNRIDQPIYGNYTGPVVPGIAQNTQTEHDWLFNVDYRGYYGHPNPSRYEWVLNGGNPTSGVDPYQVPQYPVGTQPDRNYRGVAFDFGQNYSPNGVIEYTGGAFGGALTGKILIARYSGGDDIIMLTPDANGNIVAAETGIAGFKGFVDPLDLVEDPVTGNIYVAEYGGQKLTLLKPIAPGANIEINKDTLYFNDIHSGASGGTGSSPGQKITIKNTGTSTLALPSDGLSIVGTDAGQFSISPAVSLPLTLQPGDSAEVRLVFSATSVGIKTAQLRVKSNDPDSAIMNVDLRGLGTAGNGGSLEPSLQRILDLYQIPVNVGDNNPDDYLYPVPAGAGSEEIGMPRLLKAGDGNVTIELLGVFANSKTPVIRMGWYDPGTPTEKTELFTVPLSTESQSVKPAISGSNVFDPKSGAFSLYGVFPAFTNREVYTEDALNTWETVVANRRKVRFFPLKDSDGTVVPNAYVFGFEEYTTAYDQNDIVGIVRNVKPAPSGAELGLENRDGYPFAGRLVFNRIQNLDTFVPNAVHDTSVLRIRNTGTDPLSITSLVTSGPFSLTGAPTLPAVIAAGGSLDVSVKFTGANQDITNGTLTISSNDSDEPTTVVQLTGWWQSHSEDNAQGVTQEPTLAEFVKVFGFGTSVLNSGQNMNTGGRPDKVGEEVLSAYWKRADVNAPVTVRMLAAFHKQHYIDPVTQQLVDTNSVIKWHYKGSSASSTFLFKHNQVDGQSFFPRIDGSTTNSAQAGFSPNTSSFGFKVDARFSDDALNPLDIDADGNSIPGTGHAFRFYPLKDRNGNLVPNTWIVAQDYTGLSYSNYDYQDNIYVVSNIMPESAPSAPTNLAGSSSGVGITLDWNKNTEGNVVGYRVYRSDSEAGTYALLSTSLVTGTRYTDPLAPHGQTSWYRVTAVDASGNESTLAQTSATRDPDLTPPASPSNLAGSGTPSANILSWDDNVEVDIAGYNVYRSATANGTFIKLNASLLTTTGFTDSTAISDATSYYRVTAVDVSGNESQHTEAASFRPVLGKFGNSNSIAVDSNGTTHFAWHDSATKQLKHSSRDNTGIWSAIQIVDTSGDNTGEYVSMALDASGRPSIAYFNSSKGDLQFATFNGATWDTSTIDSKQSVGLYPSLVFGADGRPAISYYRKTSGDLRVARFDGTAWVISDIATADNVGRSTSMALKSDGRLAIAYENSTTGALMFADQTGTAAWKVSTIDATAGTAFISLAIDGNGRPGVSYYDAGPADLKFAALKNGKWNINKITSNGATGLYSQLIFDNTNHASILYYNRTNDIIARAYGTLGSWSLTTLHSDGGKYISATRSPVDGQIVYSWYENALSATSVDGLIS